MSGDAATFRALHTGFTPLVLPDAWDAGSARLFEKLGSPAIATTGAGVAWALGYRDGRQMPIRELAILVARVKRAIGVPLSVDVENGYSDDAHAVGRNVLHLAALGVAGINIEDRMDDPQLLSRKIRAIREILSHAKADVFINVRTDVFFAELAPRNQMVTETLRRADVYARAGADGLFVPALFRPEDISAVATGTQLPLNVMAWPGLPEVEELAQLGVRRLSAGSTISKVAFGAAKRIGEEFLVSDDSVSAYCNDMSFGALQHFFPE